MSRDCASGWLSRPMSDLRPRSPCCRLLHHPDRLPRRHWPRWSPSLLPCRQVVARVGSRHERCRARPPSDHGLSEAAHERRQARQRAGVVSAGAGSDGRLGEHQGLAHARGLRCAGHERRQCVHAPRRARLGATLDTRTASGSTTREASTKPCFSTRSWRSTSRSSNREGGGFTLAWASVL
jgi:hypothetical protein